MNTMDLQVVTVLATLLAIVAGDCDVYGNQQPRIIERCAQIQDCFSKALLNNRNNLYILDQVFRSTQTRPPTSLIVNYNVISITNDCNFTHDHDGASSGSGFDAEVVTDTQQLNPTNDIDTGDCHGASNNYTEASGINSIGVTQIELGWSSTGIHKAIRPEFLMALQPAVYWVFLSFAIDNYGLPRTVHLSLNITNTTECEPLENITRVEMKEALEHLTEKLNYEVPGKVWNVTTDQLSTEELLLLLLMISQGILTVVLLLFILPSLYDLIPRLPRGISLMIGVVPFPIMAVEIFVNRLINTGHGAVIHDILTVVIMVLSIFSCPYGNIFSYLRIKKKSWNSLLYPLISSIAITLTVVPLPVLIGAFIYPTEVIAIIGLFVISLAGSSAIYTILDWFKRNGTPNCTSVHKNKNRNLRFTYQTYFKKLVSIILMAVSTVFFALILYMLLLRHRLESPTSQQLPTLLAFILPIFAGFGSFLLRKTLAPGTKDKLEATDETESDDNTNTPTNQTTDSDSAATDQQSDDTNSSNNQTDPPQGDPPTDDQQHDGDEQQLQSVASDTQRQESPQESEEIQVTVEIHPTNNSDVIQESIV